MLHVEKRNGNIVVFEEEKIVNAIKKAMGETDLGIDEDLAQEIAHKAFIDFSKLEVVNIEKIQDFCRS